MVGELSGLYERIIVFEIEVNPLLSVALTKTLFSPAFNVTGTENCPPLTTSDDLLPL